MRTVLCLLAGVTFGLYAVSAQAASPRPDAILEPAYQTLFQLATFAIPEPGTLALLALGSLVILSRRGRRS